MTHVANTSLFIVREYKSSYAIVRRVGATYEGEGSKWSTAHVSWRWLVIISDKPACSLGDDKDGGENATAYTVNELAALGPGWNGEVVER